MSNDITSFNDQDNTIALKGIKEMLYDEDDEFEDACFDDYYEEGPVENINQYKYQEHWIWNLPLDPFEFKIKIRNIKKTNINPDIYKTKK